MSRSTYPVWPRFTPEQYERFAAYLARWEQDAADARTKLLVAARCYVDAEARENTETALLHLAAVREQDQRLRRAEHEIEQAWKARAEGRPYDTKEGG